MKMALADCNGEQSSVNGWNSDYIESLYQEYLADSNSVDEKWRAFFQGFELGTARTPIHSDIEEFGAEWVEAQKKLENLQSRVDSLIYHYRDVGHLMAKIDPLGRNRTSHPMLELDSFGLTDDVLDMMFHADHLPWGADGLTLREIIAVLRETYCGSIGVEYMDIQNTPERRWLQYRMETTKNKATIPNGQKLRIARLLRRSTAFEKFLQTNYIGQKRFSLEGAETLIPLLDTIIEKAPQEGICEIVMGMAHRGRLNVLANILQKSYEEIFSEFEDNYAPGMIMGDGDVKYHKGASTDWTTFLGHQVHLTLTANPSHLEAVDPVVLGRVRAKQRVIGDHERSRVMGLLIHGDAAFSGQGIVAETLNLSQLQGYRTGGTIHIIVNNQIGFTTLPHDSRSGDYSTDVAKMIQAPIFHVNGDDPEAVLRVAEIAVEFRQKFKKDVVIDMYCYRRLGHNEGDEPSFTQPKLYEMIRNHPLVLDIYTKKLIDDGVATQEVLDEMAAEQDKVLSDAQSRARKQIITPSTKSFQAEWASMQQSYSHAIVETGVNKETLFNIANCWTAFPEGFEPNSKIIRLMKKRAESVLEQKKNLDWAAAEALAIGSLLAEGTPVRLSGQDSRRGTFSHRHAVIWDVNTAEMHIPLNHLGDNQARFCVYDSPLSEAGVLGFDYGYSLQNPDMMIMWEAQFGDFANGAQTIIDQFISTSESKWQRVSGLVMLLPHGYEGQGPEHSSGWVERFLQLCAEDNLQVCNVTTPAQFFHLLRRQMRRNFRKPLIVMSPKSLLRHPRAVSAFSEFTQGSFHEVLDDKTIDAKKVRRVVLSAGKVHYDLLEKREAENIQDVALVRLEQFYPLYTERLSAILERYSNATEFIWCQEETQNKGGWTFIAPMLKEELGIEFKYVGRSRHASPAVGSLRLHLIEQETLVCEALDINSKRDVPVESAMAK